MAGAVTDQSASPADRRAAIEGSLENTAIQGRMNADNLIDGELRAAWVHVSEIAADVLSLMEHGASWADNGGASWQDLASHLAEMEACLATLHEVDGQS